MSHIKKGGISYAVNVYKENAYVTNNKGVIVFDVHNPQKPKLISKITTGETFSIYVQNNLAYILGENKLNISDISDPANPRKLQEYDFKEYSQCIKVGGAYLYIASKKGLNILDVSNPEKIEFIAHIGDDWFRSIDICNSIAYVANFCNGVEVIDITKPFSPNRITTVAGTKGAVSIHIHENYLYVARSNLGISILDISSRKSPQIVGHFCDDDNGEAKDIWGNGKYLYIQDGFGDEVLDVTDPANPYEIDEHNNNGAHEIYCDGKFIYVATGRKGLIVLQLKED